MFARTGLQNSAVAPDEALAALGTSRENADRSADPMDMRNTLTVGDLNAILDSRGNTAQ